MGRPVSQRCSSGLSLQLFGVETDSFLPQGQSDGGNLSCQGEMSHGWAHPPLHPSQIIILQRTRTCAGRYGRTFEQILHIFVVVVIQTAYRDALAVALQFASYPAVLPTVVHLDG